MAQTGAVDAAPFAFKPRAESQRVKRGRLWMNVIVHLETPVVVWRIYAYNERQD